MAGLWDCLDLSKWQEARAHYDEAVATRGRQPKKAALPELDKWWCTELVEGMASKGCITKEELVKLVEWKLARGKWRPRLLSFAQQQNDAEVEEASRKAVAFLQPYARAAAADRGAAAAGVNSKGGSSGSRTSKGLSADERGALTGALNALTVLKGVGPATASGVLAAVCPALAPFMSDEALDVVHGKGQDKYTVKEYLHLADQLVAKASELNALQGKQQERAVSPPGAWSAADVERCLFAAAVLGLPGEATTGAAEAEGTNDREGEDHGVAAAGAGGAKAGAAPGRKRAAAGGKAGGSKAAGAQKRKKS